MKSLNPMLAWSARPRLLLLHAALALGLLAAPAHAATFVVTNNADSGAGSLRQAIFNANTGGGGQIVFSSVTGVITLSGGALILSNNTSITGPGPGILSVSGGSLSRVFLNHTHATSSISGLTIHNGRWYASEGLNSGGGIHNAGELILSNCVVSGNTFSMSGPILYGGGGGIGNIGTMHLDQCIVANNGMMNTSGKIAGYGGGILNQGVLHVRDSQITGNEARPPAQLGCGCNNAPGAKGGGIFNDGQLFMHRSTISDNSIMPGTNGEGNGGTGGDGGGLYTVGSLAVLSDCTISSNRCGSGGHGGGLPPTPFPFSGGRGGDGGGIWTGGVLFMTNCTVVGNHAGNGGFGQNAAGSPTYPSGDGGRGGRGGGVYSGSGFVMVSGTVISNIAGAGGRPGQNSINPSLLGQPGPPGMGGGMANSDSSPQMKNSLVTFNSAPGEGPDINGSVTSLGHNLIGLSNGNSGFTATGDMLNTNALLGPLAANGGPTLTCALLPDSPARDAGDDTLTGTDQRGFARSSGGQVDIGAYELQVPSGPMVLTGLRTNAAGGFQFSFTNTPGARFRVISSTNVAAPGTNWPVVLNFIESATGNFEYTDPRATNTPLRLFRVVWP